MFEANKNQK